MIVQQSKGEGTSLLSLKYSLCVEFVPGFPYQACAKNIVYEKGVIPIGITWG